MLHRSLTDKACEIVSGRVRVGGTVREIVQGRTLVDGKYCDILFGIPLKEIPQFATVKIREYNSTTRAYEPVEFVVAKHNYEEGLKDPASGLENRGRTLLARKYLYSCPTYKPESEAECYKNSTLDNWLKGAYLGKFSAAVQDAIGNTNFYYIPTHIHSNTKLSVLSRPVFTLSVTEYGLYSNTSQRDVHEIGTEITGLRGELEYSTSSGTEDLNSLSRSAIAAGDVAVVEPGAYDYHSAQDANHVRPIFTLPEDTMFSLYGYEIML